MNILSLGWISVISVRVWNSVLAPNIDLYELNLVSFPNLVSISSPRQAANSILETSERKYW